MKKLMVLVMAGLLVAETGHTQLTRYIIRFRHKGDNPYTLSNPSAYLSPRAIARRTRYNIPIDSTDLPITPRFIDSVRLSGAVTILNQSKWLNSITIRTTDAAALAKINSFPFVVNSTPIASRRNGMAVGEAENEVASNEPIHHRIAADVYNYGSSASQIKMHNGQLLHNIGLRGDGMQIGMLDGGFNSYLTLRAFDSARAAGQILDTWDFVALNASVNEDNAHGMQCFSVIAANIPGSFVGAAPKASFYLYRTEDVFTEFPIEEHNWVCGVERVDSAGGDVISSSLGYSDGMTDSSFNHTYAQMNGNTTIAAIGADIGARKGILIVNAAGNQGSEPFKYISTPADADSVLAVGAVNSLGWAASFTSLGPSSDGQVKPDVASLGVGTTIQTTSNTVSVGFGTSFAAPNIAGLATCLWQGFPEMNNMQIITALRISGSRFSNPNDSIGYGIPDMKKALLFLLKNVATSSGSVNNCKTTITFNSKDVSGMKYEIERRTAAQTQFAKVGEVAGTGFPFGNRTYTFQDSLIQVNAGQITYRIRQIIDTASGTAFSADYIDTVTVNTTASCIATTVPNINDPMNDWLLLPNPTHGQVLLRMRMNAALPKLSIQIVNSKGQMVWSKQVNKSPGLFDTSFDLSHLPKGEYFVTLYNADRELGSRKLIRL